MPSVLLVEDDPDMQTLERLSLEGEGYQVSTANNGAEALRYLDSATPCVIVLDLMMPVMDGLTFLAERTERGLAEGVPVVCVSAGGPELMRRARELGAVACFDKPADFEALCDAVGRFC
jgi:CheY-like chemotaxis protein